MIKFPYIVTLLSSSLFEWEKKIAAAGAVLSMNEEFEITISSLGYTSSLVPRRAIVPYEHSVWHMFCSKTKR